MARTTKKAYAQRTQPRHEWTKQEVMMLIKLWGTNTIEGIAEEIGVDKNQVKSMAQVCRQQGAELSKKYSRGQRSAIVREALIELKLIK